MSATRRRRWLIGVGVFVSSLALGLTHSDYGFDGAWVLQILARMHAGDVLYRDVFAGVPPLTFAVGYLATTIGGVEMYVLKVLVALTMALSWFAGARILSRVTQSTRYDVPLGVAIIACAQPEIASLYQPLANMFLMLALDAASTVVVDINSAGGRRGRWLVGLWCGLAFLSKQTIGVFAGAGAVVMWIAAGDRSRDWGREVRAIVIAALTAAVVIVVGLVPIVATGGWNSFLDYAFMGKGTYLAVAGVPYSEELRAFGAALVSGTGGGAVGFAKSLAIVMPVAGAIALVVLALNWRTDRRVFATGLGLAFAEFAGLYPRADVAHVIPVVPGLLVASLLAWHVMSPHRPRAALWLRDAATLIIALDVVIRFAAAGAAVATPGRALSTLPHLHGLRMPRAQLEAAAADAVNLRDAADGRPLFLLMPNAGFYYLISGVTNPTPFDYPLKPAFGPTGMSDTIDRLTKGELTQVCMKKATGLMAPDELQDYVETHMSPVKSVGVCTLYRAK